MGGLAPPHEKDILQPPRHVALLYLFSQTASRRYSVCFCLLTFTSTIFVVELNSPFQIVCVRVCVCVCVCVCLCARAHTARARLCV